MFGRIDILKYSKSLVDVVTGIWVDVVTGIWNVTEDVW